MFRSYRFAMTCCALLSLVATLASSLNGMVRAAESDSSSGSGLTAATPPLPVPVAASPDTQLAQNVAGPASSSVPPSASASTPGPAAGETRKPDAKRITDLQRALEADQQALQMMETDLANPQSEYRMAEAEFKRIDSRLEELKKELQKTSATPNGESSAKLKTDLASLQGQWNLAKDRFELAILERKTIQEKIATLKQRIQQEQQAIDKLTGAVPVEAPNPGAAGEPTAAPGPERPEASSDTSSSSAAAPAPASPVSAAGLSPTSLLPGPAIAPPKDTGSPIVSPSSPPTAAIPATKSAPGPDKPASKQLVEATQDADMKEAAARKAEDEVQSVAERMELLRRDIELEKQLLATTRKKADNALASERQLQEEYQNKLRDRAEASVIQELREKVTQAQQRFSESRVESRDRVNRLDELQSRYATLQSEQIVALQEADRTRRESDSARKTVAALRNPFTARNILQWLIDHGPRILAIVLTMLLALWTSRFGKQRIIDVMVSRGGLGKRAERENRARTLVGVFENAAKVAIISGGTLMILDTIGAPITTLMGGAAVFGLAVAFGAQSLIKDYFYGFMILLEQQYTINDVIKIGEIAGQVERITLRMTVLRDLEGRVHFVPHGAITSTTNLTHGWSRAVFEIGVAYKEDADEVIDLIKQLGQQLRDDPQFGPLILEDLTMLGVDAFCESAITIKFFIKTRPLKQWDVKRELLRRIKRAFDERGIEIPFPHRTIYHRHEIPDNLQDSADESVRRRKTA